MAGRAEKVASGERPLKKDGFVTFTGTSTSVDWDLVERARSLTGIKGYVTSIDAAVMNARRSWLPTTTSTRSSVPSG
jgi:hypothetical protein